VDHCLSFCIFFLLLIVLFVYLRFTASDYFARVGDFGRIIQFPTTACHDIIEVLLELVLNAHNLSHFWLMVRCVLNTFVSDLQQVDGFSLGTPVPSTNTTDRHDIADILLKVAVTTITLTLF
jgi:hypothetical protein